MRLFTDLYNYRELLKSNVKKEIRGKYKGSFLGILWSFVNPLLMTLVYAIIFPYLMRGSSYDNYTVFLIVGILPWSWFTTSVVQGASIILVNAGIVKKVYFPREILPISVVTSGMINFLISCLVIALFLIFSGIGFSWYIVFLPYIVLVQFIFTLSIVFIVSALDVFVRDLEYIVNFIIQMLFYVTPILYAASMFDNTKFEILMKINPMAIIINSYKDIFYWQSLPHIRGLFFVLLGSILLCFLGLRIFRRLAKGFAEEI